MDISVVIAHIGDQENIQGTIESHYKALKKAKLDFEIIISDNGSFEDELEILKTFIKKHPQYRIKLVHESTVGTIPAFQTGILQAAGKYLCISDSHIAVSRNYYIKQIPLIRDDVVLVYAPARFSFEDKELVYEYGWNYFSDYKSTFRNIPRSKTEPYYVGVSQMGAPIILRDVFMQYGMFGETAFEKYGGYTAEELLLGLKCWMFGYKVLMNPNTYYIHAKRVRGRQAGKKEQPAAFCMMSYLIEGEDRAKEMVEYYQFGINEENTNPSYEYTSIEQAFEDLKRLGDRDRDFIVNNAKYTFPEVLDIWKELKII